MSTVYITLKTDQRGDWYLHAPLGHQIAGPFRGSKDKAVEWGRKYVSTWPNWAVRVDENEEKS